MIAKLTGKVDELKPTELIIDVNGVGYHLHIPITTYEKILSQKDITVYVYTYHKEDQLKLFGFHDEKLKSLFSILINVSGIGPSMALSILSGISPEMLTESVKTGNVNYLVKIPGIGKTKAEKLIFELKRKMKKLERFAGKNEEKSLTNHDAVEALVSLGFNETKSFEAINQIISGNANISLESLIKEGLKMLSS